MNTPYWTDDVIALYKKLTLFSKDKKTQWHQCAISYNGLDGFSYRVFDKMVHLQKSGAIDIRNIKCTFLIISDSRKKANITLKRLINLRNTIQKRLEIYPTYLDISITKLGQRVINKELKRYLDDYLESKLTDNYKRYYTYPVIKSVIFRTIGGLAKIYGPTNLLFNKYEMWNWVTNQTERAGYLDQTKFWEAVLSMEGEGFFKIIDVINSMSLRLSIISPRSIPAQDDWNKDFFDIASSLAYFDFISRKHKESQLRKPKKDALVLVWKDLSLNLDNGMAKFGDKEHRFRVGKPHFKVLKLLLKKNGEEATYEEFFKEVIPAEPDNPKAGKEFIRQKIRDIRKYFGLNRYKNQAGDIFFDTGNGFKLQRLGISPKKITE